MDILFLVIGLILGAIIGFLIGKSKGNPTVQTSESNSEKDQQLVAQLQDEKLVLSISNGELSKEKEILVQRNDKIEEEIRELRIALANEKELNASLKTKQENLEELLVKQKDELTSVQEKFTKEFELIANKILDANTQKFSEQNKEKLGEILTPFQERINNFKETVEKSNEKNSRERIELSEHIKHLKFLNETMQKETQSLTLALKQDSKAQGNWGEVILERVLESSGLEKGREYFTQQTFSESESDKALRPDVIVRLPDDKNIIIDSKVSLTAYNELINAENEEAREIAMKAHLLSVRNHVTNLANKNYQFAEGLNTPDFVLLFMPIESSFSIATQGDNELFNFAWSKKIVIVSPSTLLATLRTIASVWKHEYQNKNALDIADRAAKLYEKFVGFVEDMQKIEKQLKGAESAYDAAFNKLSSGRGNLINSSQKLIELGVKAKKKLPEDLID